jgi:hypothetical protein
MFKAESYGPEYWAVRGDESLGFFFRQVLPEKLSAFAQDLHETLEHYHPTVEPHLQPEAIQRILDSGMKATDETPEGLLDPSLVPNAIKKVEEESGAV